MQAFETLSVPLLLPQATPPPPNPPVVTPLCFPLLFATAVFIAIAAFSILKGRRQ